MRAAFPKATDADTPAKPKGGYRIINGPILAAAWTAYRLKSIRLVDLRVWFAAHEMDARRCQVEHRLPKKFTTKELRKLTGLSARRTKDSLRRLQDAHLLEWAQSGLSFPYSPDDLPVKETLGFRAILDGIPNANRKVPVPRRTLRLIAGGARPALIATILGHLVRGLYLKRGKCFARGRVKASWIADTFGIGLRRVKQARCELIACGWIIPLDADQWALNRWGAHFRINLGWSRLDASETITRSTTTDWDRSDDVEEVRLASDLQAAGTELAPPPAVFCPELAPPESYEEPLDGREKNQKPASGGPAGISIDNVTDRTSGPQIASQEVRALLPPAPVFSPAPVVQTIPSVPPGSRLSHTSGTTRPSPGKPDLRNVVVEDLKDTGRLLELYAQAIVRGWVTMSDRDRLRVVGAAEHARVIGTKNPCGLFVRLIRCGLWSFLTQDDEDAASARLKRHLYGKSLERAARRSRLCVPLRFSQRTLCTFGRSAQRSPGQVIGEIRFRC